MTDEKKCLYLKDYAGLNVISGMPGNTDIAVIIHKVFTIIRVYMARLWS